MNMKNHETMQIKVKIDSKEPRNISFRIFDAKKYHEHNLCFLLTPDLIVTLWAEWATNANYFCSLIPCNNVVIFVSPCYVFPCSRISFCM